MNHDEVRARLAEVIAGLDAGRYALPSAARRSRRVGAPLLVAAIGLGAAGCPSRDAEPPVEPGPSPTAGPTPEPAYMAPDPGVMPEYMAPDPAGPDPAGPDPGPTVEYMAPDPSAEPLPPARPMYGVPAEPGTRRGGRRPVMPPPDPGPVAEYMAPDPGPVALYAAPNPTE